MTALAMTVAGFTLAAIVATLLSLMDPDASSRGPSKLPIASHPSAAVGQQYGLIPNVALQTGSGNTVSAQSLRPGVLALIPLHCQCAPLLTRLAGDAAAQTLPLMVVAPTVADADAEAAALSGQLDAGHTEVYYDSSGALAGDFGAQRAHPGRR